MAQKQPLPDGWVWTRIGEISTCQSGSGFPKSFQGLTSGDYPLAKVSDITDATKFNNGIIVRANNYLSTADAKKIGAKIFPPGTTLFAKIGEAVKLNRRVISSIEILADNNVMGLIPKTNSIFPRFLYYFMHLVDLYEYTQATTVPSVRKTDIESIELPLPPLPEQERIVAKIEELFTQLDAGVAALKRIQAGLKRYRASVLKAACEGRLVPQDPADEPAAEVLRRLGKQPRQQVDLIQLPNGWCWTILSDVCEKIQDGTHFSPKLQYQEAGEDKYLYITAKNIKESGISLSDVTYVDGSIHHEITARCDPRKGDVLLIKDGVTTGIATVNELDEEFSLLSSVSQLRPNQIIVDPYFLKFYLNSPTGRQMIIGKMTGVAIRRIILAQIKRSPILIPPLSEQQRIVAEVERRLSVANQISTSVEIALQRAARLRQAILKRAFEGKLVAPGRER